MNMKANSFEFYVSSDLIKMYFLRTFPDDYPWFSSSHGNQLHWLIWKIFPRERTKMPETQSGFLDFSRARKIIEHVLSQF